MEGVEAHDDPDLALALLDSFVLHALEGVHPMPSPCTLLHDRIPPHVLSCRGLSILSNALRGYFLVI